MICLEKNVLLTIEYDGTCFHGWQRQEGLRTVQGQLEDALSKVCRFDVTIDGTGRTDRGVHALGQRATFSGDFGIPVERLPRAVNNILAGGRSSGGDKIGDLRIVEAQQVPMDFHARFSCRGKTYRYVISTGEVDIFRRNYSYHIWRPLDILKMRQASAYITGTHDFACFQAAGGTPRLTTVRTVYDLNIKEQGTDIIIDVTGDGFLYNMVRIIVGTLVDVGHGKISPEALADIIESGDRTKAGHTAPAEGLYLYKVYFDDEFKKLGGL